MHVVASYCALKGGVMLGVRYRRRIRYRNGRDARDFGNAIREGAEALLLRQYTTIERCGGLAIVVLWGTLVARGLAFCMKTVISFLGGAGAAGLAGVYGNGMPIGEIRDGVARAAHR